MLDPARKAAIVDATGEDAVIETGASRMAPTVDLRVKSGLDGPEDCVDSFRYGVPSANWLLLHSLSRTSERQARSN